MDHEALLQEWRRMTRALAVEQDMYLNEIAVSLDMSRTSLKDILSGHTTAWDAARITAVLQDLRSPFDDERLMRKQFINVA